MISSNEELQKYCSQNLMPIKGQLALTGQCNLNCIHCFRINKGPDLAISEWKLLLNEIKELGCLFVNLTGGELFARKDIYEIVSYTRKNNFFVSIQTNASLIDKRTASFLKKIGVSYIVISMYGDNASVHDSITQVEGSFKNSVDGILNLLEEGLDVTVSCLMMKPNSDRFINMKNFFAQIGVRCQFFYLLSPKLDGNTEPLDLFVGADIVLEHFYLGVENSFFEKEEDLERKLDDFPCGGWHTSFFVDSNGDAMPCALHPYVMGNVKYRCFANIWKDMTNTLSLKVRNLRIKDIPVCRSCNRLPVCRICPAQPLLRDGILGPYKDKCDIVESRQRYLDVVRKEGS